MPNQPMSTVFPLSAPQSPLRPLFPQSYVPALVGSPKPRNVAAPPSGVPAKDPSKLTQRNRRPPRRKGHARPPGMTQESDCYPSSSSPSEVLSPQKVLAMVPEARKAPSKFVGKRKTACPTYANSVWPREKACCVHTCGGSTTAEPSSSAYCAAQVLAIRSFWYELTPSDRRQFIANRMEDVWKGGDAPVRRYYMDPPTVISSGGLTLAAKPQVGD